MTPGERMKRWRENPENRAKERQRNIARRRKQGMKPHVRMTDEERTVLNRIRARRSYASLLADPVRREKKLAYYRAKYWKNVEESRARSRERYAKRKTMAEQNVENVQPERNAS